MENTKETKKKKPIGWIIVAVIVAIALIWWGISAISNAHRRNAAPLPAKITASDQTRSVHYRYDKDTRILYVTGDTASWKWLIPFIDTSTPLGRETALIAASGDNISSIMVYYILSTSPTISSGKVAKVKLALPNGGRTDYYFLTRGGKTTRINAFKVTYDGDLVTSIGDRAFGYNENGLLQTVGDVITMQFNSEDQLSSMKLADNITGSQYQFSYKYSGDQVFINYIGKNAAEGFTESGKADVVIGTANVKSLNNNQVKYGFEIIK